MVLLRAAPLHRTEITVETDYDETEDMMSVMTAV